VDHAKGVNIRTREGRESLFDPVHQPQTTYSQVSCEAIRVQGSTSTSFLKILHESSVITTQMTVRIRAHFVDVAVKPSREKLRVGFNRCGRVAQLVAQCPFKTQSHVMSGS